MRLQSKSKVWLWTRRIIANCDILINFSNRLFYIRWWQVQTSRDDMQQSLSKIFHVVAVLHNSIPANATCISFCVSGKKKDIWCNVLTGMKIGCLTTTCKNILNSRHNAIKEASTATECHVEVAVASFFDKSSNHITTNYLRLAKFSSPGPWVVPWSEPQNELLIQRVQCLIHHFLLVSASEQKFLHLLCLWFMNSTFSFMYEQNCTLTRIIQRWAERLNW